MEDEALTPVLRITDAEAAIAWYKRLGFVVDSEWSSGPTFRETMAVVRRGDLALILSSREKGLSRSDSLLCFRVADLTPFEQEFNVAASSLFWGRHMELHDPDGNQIRIVAVTIKPRKGRLIGPN